MKSSYIIQCLGNLMLSSVENQRECLPEWGALHCAGSGISENDIILSFSEILRGLRIAPIMTNQRAPSYQTNIGGCIWVIGSRRLMPIENCRNFPKIVSVLALRVTSIFIGFTIRFFLLFTDSPCAAPM